MLVPSYSCMQQTTGYLRVTEPTRGDIILKLFFVRSKDIIWELVINGLSEHVLIQFTLKGRVKQDKFNICLC